MVVEDVCYRSKYNTLYIIVMTAFVSIIINPIIMIIGLIFLYSQNYIIFYFIAIVWGTESVFIILLFVIIIAKIMFDKRIDYDELNGYLNIEEI